ncbi:MAG TPA: hypothetical protein VGG35_14695 [Streptosporangiaceae bacterium]|jgi:hypothetical protein
MTTSDGWSGRLCLGWQHAPAVPEPGPRPAPPPAAPAIAVSAGWRAAQYREAGRLARPHRTACACSAAAGAAAATAGLAGLLPAGLAGLAGLSAAGLLAAAAASLRVLHRDRRALRDRLAAEEVRVGQFRAAAQREQRARRADHARQQFSWRQRRAAFARQPQWYPVWLPAGLHRLDVAGGTLAGWSALLTSVAAPLLAAGGEVTVLDLTEGPVAADLLAVARARGIEPLVWVLPADLPRLDLGAGLPPAELAEVLATAIDASAGPAPGPAGDPAADAALLGRVLDVLGAGATIAQLTAGLRVLAQVGDPRADMRAGLLTGGQLDGLARLFGRAAADRVVVDRAWTAEARLRPLEPLGQELAGLPSSPLRLAWLDRAAGAAATPMLAGYLTVALTQALRRAPAAEPAQAIVVLGAERLGPPVLDRLADACESAGVALVVAYRSLPGHVRDRLGRGNAAVAFMRLGNAQDARAAAEQIGTEHRFMLSQLTQTIGDSVTVTTGDSYTSTVSAADSVAGSASVTDTAGRSRGSRGGFAPFAGPGPASRDRSASRAVAGSLSVTEQISTSTAWGMSTSRALGASTSLAAGAQRSREFLVEQHELQQLPPSAVLLTYAGPAGRQVVLADANPAIGGLPIAAPVSLAGSPRAGTPPPWPPPGPGVRSGGRGRPRPDPDTREAT